MNKAALPVLLAVGLALPGAAQPTPVVYTYVEQMPVLPGSSRPGALKMAIERHTTLPAADQRRRTFGRILVAFVVTETGVVTTPHIVKGLTTTADAAVLQSVRQLPRLTPGRHAGRTVSVALTIPIDVGQQFAAQAAERDQQQAPDLSDLSGEGSRAVEEVDTERVYTYVEQMPALPGGGGLAAVLAAVQRQLVVPAGVPEGRVFVSFVVDKEGQVQDVQIQKGLSASVDAAVQAAVRKLPAFVAGRQNGRPVQVRLQLPVTVRPAAAR